MPAPGTAPNSRVCAVLLLLLGVILPARGQVISDWVVKGRGHIFPSLIIAEAAREMEMSRTEGTGYDKVADLIGAGSNIGVAGAGNAAFLCFLVTFDQEIDEPIAVTVEISCPKFMEPSRLSQRVIGGAKWIFAPFSNWKFDALYSVTEPEPTTMTFRLLGSNGEELSRRSANLLVHSINECVLEYLPYERLNRADSARYFQKSHRLLAAYVNENHPLIDRILKTALDQKFVPRFLGPQARDENTARLELESIWRVLQLMGFRYSSLAKVSTELEFFRTQNVRFLDEALSSTQVNCVDG